ncbi:hypothetical protein NADFUDRAFT_82799 [Nadsonia fulvescens var. elongata DSM 6958]|uniref:Translocon-associated protein subunit alpha n=1 Tax=Nadsonia fulvescens var. elongata DSM 6958 TaxID=857566 RepID=A0A1E3PKI3_9ASCO|nr:hypothetical protein NADFUDRAFT_82799 [Nadsonia fulvescens var. elongata DSM 6958]
MMKYFNWLSKTIILFALLAAVVAQSGQEDGSSKLNFEVNVRAMVSLEDDAFESEGAEFVGVPQLPSGEESLFKVKFTNHENIPVQVLAVGGSFYNPKNEKIVAELKTASFKPQLVLPTQSIEINQRVRALLNPDDYLLILTAHVLYKEETVALITYKDIVSVFEVSVSFFDPQFLAVVLILGILATTIGYYARHSYFKSAVAASSRLSSKAELKKGKFTGGASTTLDESWLPAEHRRIVKPKKTKKAE